MTKNIAICGITGVVGKETLRCLDELNFPVGEIACFASSRSAGKKIQTPFGEQTIQEFSVDACTGYDFVFLCISGDFSAEFGRQLADNNKYVIDNSSYFRYDDDIPLVVPEVNATAVRENNLIANPNCTTAILAVALYPLYKAFGLKKVIVSTYQATSGGGLKAMKELENETQVYLNNLSGSSNEKPVTKNDSCFAHPIPFNLIPAIDKFQPNGYTKEEMKVVWETRKIFGDENLPVSCTAVRIPTFRAHAESVVIQTERPINPAAARKVLASAPGLKLVDDPTEQQYPMPLTVSAQFAVEVGRVRQNLVFGDQGLEFFICGDQLLKGAALNTVQIAQALLNQK